MGVEDEEADVRYASRTCRETRFPGSKCEEDTLSADSSEHKLSRVGASVVIRLTPNVVNVTITYHHRLIFITVSTWR